MNEHKFLTEYFGDCINFLSNVNVNKQIIDAKEIILETKRLGGKECLRVTGPVLNCESCFFGLY